MLLVGKKLPTIPKHLSSPTVFSGVRVTRCLVYVKCFVHRCLPFCHFSFGHCVVCSSSINGFWLPLSVSSNSSLDPMCRPVFLDCPLLIDIRCSLCEYNIEYRTNHEEDRSIYRFLLALWHLQSLLDEDYSRNTFVSFSFSLLQIQPCSW